MVGVVVLFTYKPSNKSTVVLDDLKLVEMERVIKPILLADSINIGCNAFNLLTTTEGSILLYGINDDSKYGVYEYKNGIERPFDSSFTEYCSSIYVSHDTISFLFNENNEKLWFAQYVNRVQNEPLKIIKEMNFSFPTIVGTNTIAFGEMDNLGRFIINFLSTSKMDTISIRLDDKFEMNKPLDTFYYSTAFDGYIIAEEENYVYKSRYSSFGFMYNSKNGNMNVYRTIDSLEMPTTKEQDMGNGYKITEIYPQIYSANCFQYVMISIIFK